MCEDLQEPAYNEDDTSGMILLSVRQGHAFETAVAEGRFVTFDEAVNASVDELAVTTVGTNRYLAEALEQLRLGMEEAARGEYVSSEEIEAWFDEWRRELDERTDD